MAEWDVHFELAAIADLAFNFDGAAMHRDEFVHQRQADAAAFMTAAPCALNTSEAFKEIRHILFRDSGAGVVDRQQRAILLGRNGNPNLAIKRSLKRIREK